MKVKLTEDFGMNGVVYPPGRELEVGGAFSEALLVGLVDQGRAQYVDETETAPAAAAPVAKPTQPARPSHAAAERKRK